jgi:CDP-glucose 4,6-dehydratase
MNPSTEPFQGAFAGKRVFVTGHTGFKGSWLCEWLLQLGAKVTGYSLPPYQQPSLFEHLGLAPRLHHIEADIRDLEVFSRAVADTKPDFVFHLAAQPIVRESYAKPVGTFATNLMGTVHMLDALRHLQHPCAAVLITTDKCYENREWLFGYREEDPLGGYDPYSASKAASELAISSYRRSFFGAHPVKIASARAGNVIGGGDWALDRITPDCMRLLSKGQPIGVRNLKATRPWQHVLEPLSGYLWLAACLSGAVSPAPAPGPVLASAFNFGPQLEANRSVRELVEEILKHWPGSWVDQSDPKAVHEAKLLYLAVDKAFHLLHWRPVWCFAEAVKHTVHWYRAVANAGLPGPGRQIASEQIAAYTADARAAGLLWAGKD